MAQTTRSTDPARRIAAWAEYLKGAGDYDVARAVLAEHDLAFLLVEICGRVDLLHPWLLERCDEVEAEPDGHIDLWAREHGKSSIITFGKTLQDICRDPEVTIGIFSHTRPIAKAFLAQLMREMESNALLPRLWPHVFWNNPRREAPQWSLDGGVIVKRKTNPKEATIEAWGLVDGQPTSRHFQIMVFDDVVTRESVTTPEQVRKTTEAFELADNLGVSEGGRRRIIGTRYSFADTYAEILARGIAIPRLYPATHDGTVEGHPVLFTQEEWERRKKTQPTTLPAQLLQNPAAGLQSTFRPHWLRSYEIRPLTMHVAILVDPSKGSPNRRSDRTAIAVIGSDAAGSRYLLDGYCHRMNLAERWQAIKTLYRHWSKAPGVLSVMVGYERYGMQTDLEAIEWRQQIEKTSIVLEELNTPKDHTRSKIDRVERLVPDFKFGRFFIPMVLVNPSGGHQAWTIERSDGDTEPNADKARWQIKYHDLAGPTRRQREAAAAGRGALVIGPIKRVDEAKRVYDVTRVLIEEFLAFPFAPHDDFIDATSRIYDVEGTALPPAEIHDEQQLEPETYVDS